MSNTRLTTDQYTDGSVTAAKLESNIAIPSITSGNSKIVHGAGLTKNGSTLTSTNGFIYKYSAVDMVHIDENGNMYVKGNLELGGNINSVTTTVATLEVSDSEIILNAGVTSPYAGGAQLTVDRGGSNYDPYIKWDETNKYWILYNGTDMARIIDQAYGDSRYVNITGDTLSGDLIIGATTRGANSFVRTLSADGYNSGFEAYGSVQGTGYLYVGQSASYGGGIFYNGDGTPGFAAGESADYICLYRNSGGTNSVVMKYSQDSNDVTFTGDIVVSGNRVTFSNGSYIHNEVDGALFLIGDGNVYILGTSTGNSLQVDSTSMYHVKAGEGYTWFQLDGANKKMGFGPGTAGRDTWLYRDAVNSLKTDGNFTAATHNKVTITTPTNGSTLTIADGKTLTVNNTITLSGTDASTLNIGTGGTLGTAAYTASSAYLPIGGGTLTGGLTIGVTTSPEISIGNGSSVAPVLKFRSTGTQGWITYDDVNDTFLFKDSSTAYLPISAYIFKSTANSVAPFNIQSTVKVTNLNADLLDDQDGSYYLNLGNATGYLTTTSLGEPPYVTGNITKTSKPVFDVLRGDRTAFLPASQIIIEQSTDAGVTWTDAGYADTSKIQLFSGTRPTISIPLKNGVKSTDCMIRITITGMKYNVPGGTAETDKYNYWNSTYVQSTERYFDVSEGWAWVSSSTDRIYMKVERATGAASTAWSTEREAYLQGWSGGNYFSLPSGTTFGGGTSQTTNWWNWRFTFRTCTNANTFNDAALSTLYTTSAQSIFHIKISGTNVWNYSNPYMYNEHLYSWDQYQNVAFAANVRGNTLASIVATGTAPITVNSTTKVANLNSDYLDGCQVNDSGTDTSSLWTASKLTTQLAGKSPTNHDLIGGHSATLSTATTAGFFLKATGTTTYGWAQPVKADVGLSNVENTALSTWAGTTNITTVGAVTATSVNKVTITAPTTSAVLTIANGKTLTANSSIILAGVDSKTLTVNKSIILDATGDGSTLNIGSGGTLGSAAFTASSAYLPIGGGTVTGNLVVNTNSGANGLYITRTGSLTNEHAQYYTNDGMHGILYTNDESASNITWTIYNTDTETGGGVGANHAYLKFYSDATTYGLALSRDNSNYYNVWHANNLAFGTGHSNMAYGDHIHGAHVAGNGISGADYTGGAQTWSIASAPGTAGSVGTIVVTADSIGVALGNTSTTAAPGIHSHTAADLPADKYLSAVSGTCNGTITYTIANGTNVTWNSAHTHSAADLPADKYLSGVSGSCGGTITFTVANGANVTWDSSHAHTSLTSMDDRDVKPADTPKARISSYFTSVGGMTGAASGTYLDLLVMNTWSDASGGNINALAFDKSARGIRHYYVAQGDTTWGTAYKTLAYAEDDKHLSGVSGTCGGTVTFTMANDSNITWDSTHTHSYLPLAGGTLTGALAISATLNSDSYTGGALHLSNSNIDGINSIYFNDASDNQGESINFYNTSTTVDSLYANAGVLYFVPNRALGGTGTANAIWHAGNLAFGTGASNMATGNHVHSSLTGANRSLTLGSSSWSANNGETNVLGEIYDNVGSGNSRLMIHSSAGYVNVYADGTYYGKGSTEVAYSNDSRFTDARTPVAHGDSLHNCYAYARVTFAAGKSTATWTHNKNWADYIVQITPDSPETHFYYANKTANAVDICLDDAAYEALHVDVVLINASSITAITAP